jgi:c-di-GMP-binding flagellar brake protein YcgR
MKERRLAKRAKTSLEAYYWDSSAPTLLIKRARVVDLSLGGCCLLLSQEETFNLGNKIKLSIRLDDDKRTKIERDASVCNIKGNYVNCIFAPRLHGSEPELIAYINAHS